MPLDDAPTTLHRYVELHNHGVKSGDFAELIELFDDEALMVFHGLPLGPFRGRQAIGQAFAERPPDDELIILDTCGDPGCVTARYAWQRNPTRCAGQIGVEVRDGQIMRLTVRAIGVSSPSGDTAAPIE
jgi:steroid delta-isomerase